MSEQICDQENQKKSVERDIGSINKDIADVKARKREQLADAAKYYMWLWL